MIDLELFDMNKYRYLSKFTMNKKTYSESAFCIDIETTSAYLDFDGVHIVDKQKYDDKGNALLKKIAFPYIYMIGFENDQYSTRSQKIFYDFLSYISDFFDDIYIICWVQNLSFEFSFFYNFLNFEDIFAVRSNTPIKCYYKNIEFRDMYIVTGLSLKKVGDNLGVPKMIGDLDYSIFREPDTHMSQKELGYCKNDVVIPCIWFMKEIMEIYIVGKKSKWIPLTKTSKVRKYVKDKITDRSAWNRYLKTVFPTKKMYEILHACMWGGLTTASINHIFIIKENLLHIDLTSAHPANYINEKYPLNQWYKCEDPYENYEQNAYIRHVIFIDIKIKKELTPIIPISKIIKQYKVNGFNGMVWSAKMIEIWCTDIDFNYFIKFYDGKYKIIESYANYKENAPLFLMKSVEYWYSEKKERKKEKREYEKKCGKENYTEWLEYARNELYAKEYINSMFGMCATGIVHDNWSIKNNEWVSEKTEYPEKMPYSFFLPYELGVWCTAYTRKKIYDLILYAKELFVYGDTDSGFLIKNKKMYEYIDFVNKNIRKKTIENIKKYNLSEELIGIGEWDIEEENVENFLTTGKKRYVADGSPTVAGIKPEKIIEYCDKKNKNIYELFNDGINIEPELSGKNTIYTEYREVKEYILPSGKPILIGGFTHVEPTSFASNATKNIKKEMEKC